VLFFRVYRLEIQSVMLIFSAQLCELLTLSPSLWFNSPPPPPFPVWISTVYCIHEYTLWIWGGYGVLGLRQINICRKVPWQVNFFRWWNFVVPSMSLIFLRVFLLHPEDSPKMNQHKKWQAEYFLINFWIFFLLCYLWFSFSAVLNNIIAYKKSAS
jgi:hypothetical protein